jgi:general secretion pathway protein N
LSRRLAGLGLACFLFVALLVSAPARLATLLLPADQVLLQGLQGSLWHGSASRCLLSLPAGHLQLGQLSWHLKPLSLLSLSPRIELDSQWGNQSLSATVTLRGQEDIDLSNVDAIVPAMLVRQFLPLAVGGNISLQLDHLSIRGQQPAAAAGRLVWQAAVWNSPQGRIPLGDYAVDIAQAEGEPLQGTLLTLSGPVRAEGIVELSGRNYSVAVNIYSESSLDAQIQQALSLVAAATDQGFALSLSGEI